MKIYDICLPPNKIENRPNVELANKMLNQFCLENEIIPGVSNPYQTYAKFKNKDFTTNKYFRRVIDTKPEEVDLVEFMLEPYVVKEYNISTDTMWCGHYECFNNAKKIDVESKKVYFCQEQKGIFPEFLENSDPRWHGYAARLLRTPTTDTNWFSEYVAKAYYEILKKEYDDVIKNSSEIKITELNSIFSKDVDKTKQRYPKLIGKTIYKNTKALGFDSERYAFMYKNKVHIVGSRVFSRLYPDLINGTLKQAISARFQQADMGRFLNGLWEVLRAEEPENFIIETVLKRRPETYKDTTRADTALRKELGKRYFSLKKQGKIKEDETIKKAGRFVKGVITKSGVKLIQECSDSDLKNVDREYYFAVLAGKSFETVTGIDPKDIVRTNTGFF